MKKIRIKKQYIKDFEKAIKAWKAQRGDDKELIACYKNDRADLRKIVSFIKKRQFKEADEAIYELDTVVRDQVPEEIYDLIVN